MESMPAPTVQLARLYEWIRDIREHFSREMDQAILKRDLYLGMEAMGGRDACDRIKRNIEARFHMDENWIAHTAQKPHEKSASPLPSWHSRKRRSSPLR